MLIANLSRAGSSAAVFFLVGKFIGAIEFAIFSAIVALITIVGPFAAFGFGGEAVRKITQDGCNLDEVIGKALSAIALSNLINIPLVSFFWVFVYDNNLISLVAFAISELMFYKLIEILSQLYQVQKKTISCAILIISHSVVRIVCVACLLFFVANITVEQVSLVMLLCNMVFSLLSLLFFCVKSNVVPLFMFLSREEFWRSMSFSVGLSSQGVYNDADKIVVSRFSSDLAGGGIYAMSYKVIDMACMPLKSLLAISYPKFFEYGLNGVAGTYFYAKNILKKSIKIGVFATVVALGASFLVEIILGPDYLGIFYCVTVLSLIPLVRSVHYVLGDCLTGAGFQKSRSVIQGFVAFLSVSASIPAVIFFGYMGAALISVLCDVILLVTLFFVIRKRLLN